MTGKLKLKTVFKNEKTYLIMSLKKKEVVNESLIQSIDQPNYSELISASWTKSGGRNKLTFDISNLVSLREYIKAEITQEKYFQLINQIQKIYEKCSKSSMPASNLICSIDYTYYDPKKSKLYMLYAPIANSTYSSNIVKYLYTLHKKASVIVSDSNMINKYKEFLETKLFIQKKNKDKNASCSYNDIYNFLHDQEKHDTVDNEPLIYAVPEPAPQTDQNKYYQPAKKAEPAINFSKNEHKISKTVKASPRARTTTEQSNNHPYIEDSQQIKHYITSFPFIIGRAQDADLVIENQNISSHHAFIEEQNGTYYIRDNDSTNGTYINGKEIKYEAVENETMFSLYDVNFIFHTRENNASADLVNMPTLQPLTKTFAAKKRNPQAGEYCAYIQNVSTQQNIFINSYPCTISDIPGIEITGSVKSPVIRNISCNDLIIESERIEKDIIFPLFSGCSFSTGNQKYIFYMKN